MAYCIHSVPGGCEECRRFVAILAGTTREAGVKKVNRDRPSVALTRRDMDVLRGLSIGQTCKEIAAGLGLSNSSVRGRIDRLRRVFGVSCVRLLVKSAYERGFLRVGA